MRERRRIDRDGLLEPERIDPRTALAIRALVSGHRVRGKRARRRDERNPPGVGLEESGGAGILKMPADPRVDGARPVQGLHRGEQSPFPPVHRVIVRGGVEVERHRLEVVDEAGGSGDVAAAARGLGGSPKLVERDLEVGESHVRPAEELDRGPETRIPGVRHVHRDERVSGSGDRQRTPHPRTYSWIRARALANRGSSRRNPSGFVPRTSARWYAKSWSGTRHVSAVNGSGTAGTAHHPAAPARRGCRAASLTTRYAAPISPAIPPISATRPCAAPAGAIRTNRSSGSVHWNGPCMKVSIGMPSAPSYAASLIFSAISRTATALGPPPAAQLRRRPTWVRAHDAASASRVSASRRAAGTSSDSTRFGRSRAPVRPWPRWPASVASAAIAAM